MSPRKFFRTKIVAEVLSEFDPHFRSLEDAGCAIATGDSSGIWEQSTEEINAKTCAKVLMKQGSEPEFFLLTEGGEDLEGA